MNDSKLGITRENLLLIVPPALTHDPAMMARAAADAEALAARLAEIDRVRIISNIDALDETVLDILARDFKVEEQGIISPVLSVEASYLRMLHFGDSVQIETWVKERWRLSLRIPITI